MNLKSSLSLSWQIATTQKEIPPQKQVRQWIVSVLTNQHIPKAALTVRFVDDQESAELNERYRHKQGPTNVLAFPFEPMDCQHKIHAKMTARTLGDLVICVPVVKQEAIAQHKLLLAHFAHMVIHGTLHLLGYDHEQPEQASIMEQLEIELLQLWGYPDPYDDQQA